MNNLRECFKKCHPFNFYDNFVRCRPIYLILNMIIGQSVYNVPVLTYLLETEIFSIVKHQLKCCSVANDAVPGLSHGLVWSSVLSTRPSTSGMDSWAPVWELMDNTLNICP